MSEVFLPQNLITIFFNYAKVNIRDITCSKEVLLDHFLSSCISFLQESVAISFFEHQNKNEEWLLKILRIIYKEDPKSFTVNHIGKLESFIIPNENRIPVLPLDHKPTAGKCIRSKYGFFLPLIVEEGRYGFERNDFKSFFLEGELEKKHNYHNSWISQLASVHSSIAPETSATVAAKLILNQLPNYENFRYEEVVRSNYANHRKTMGLPSASLNKVEKKNIRETHCYACKKELKTNVQLECSLCGWLVCECGACGCGYNA